MYGYLLKAGWLWGVDDDEEKKLGDKAKGRVADKLYDCLEELSQCKNTPAETRPGSRAMSKKERRKLRAAVALVRAGAGAGAGAGARAGGPGGSFPGRFFKPREAPGVSETHAGFGLTTQ